MIMIILLNGGYGKVRRARLDSARCGVFRQGFAGKVWWGMVGWGTVWSGLVSQVR